MKKRLLVAISIAALCSIYVSVKGHRVSGEPVPVEPYVFIYGRDTCGYTARIRQKLDRNGIEYHYFQINNPEVQNNLHRRMQSAGLKTARYRLPVVEVNRYMFIQPDVAEVMKRYQ